MSRLVIVVFSVAAVLIAVTGAAQAAPGAGFEIQPAVAGGSVDLGKRDGYELRLYMLTDRVVMLSVSKSHMRGERGFLFVGLYAVHNRRSLKRGLVRARFGSLGTISLRFRPNGQVHRYEPQRGCEGRPAITEYGRFVGSVTFRGERDYLRFSLRGGVGDLTRTFRLRCEKGEALDVIPQKSLRASVAPGSFFATEGDIALLYASSRAHGRYVGIVAGHREGEPPGAEVRVGALESRGGMAIGRYAFIQGPPGTLLTSLPGVHPATATLAPPAPLFGEGVYEETTAGSHSWTGTLGMDLLGLKLPLAGPGFHARLCTLNPLKTRNGCDFFKAEPPNYERSTRPGARFR